MTSPNELSRRLTDHEDRLTERKSEGVSPRDLRRAVVGFANSVPQGQAAVLYIGLGDDGKLLGVSNPDALLKRVRGVLQDCYPPIAYETEVLSVEGTTVVAVVVPHSTRRPHFAGPAYIRMGSETVEATEQQYRELLTRHFSKADAILEWKDRVITVMAWGKQLGVVGPVPGRYRYECIVRGCEPHFVQLQDRATDRFLSEPLDNITISADEKQNGRLMLIVRYPAS